MEKISEMINRMCPEGVDKFTLGSLGTFENIGVDKKVVEGEKNVVLLNYVDVYHHKYIDANIPSMIVTAPDKKLIACNVLAGDICVTPTSETVDDIGHSSVIIEDIPNCVYSYHIMRYRLREPNKSTSHYINYLFDLQFVKQQILKKAQGLTRFGLSKDKFASIEIPLPPLPIQQEIVRILDSFTSMITNLETELASRQKQYEHYREELLKFRKDECTLQTIRDFSSVLRGKRLTKNMLSNSNTYPVYHGGNEPIGYYTESNRPARTVMVINVGASAGTVGFCDKAFWSSDGCFCLKKNADVDDKFLYHSLKVRENEIMSKVRTAGIPTLDNKVVENIILPIPSLKRQQEIVSTLDAFESLITNIKQELEARKKQYEYYRELLLTFE